MPQSTWCCALWVGVQRATARAPHQTRRAVREGEREIVGHKRESTVVADPCGPKRAPTGTPKRLRRLGVGRAGEKQGREGGEKNAREKEEEGRELKEKDQPAGLGGAAAAGWGPPAARRRRRRSPAEKCPERKAVLRSATVQRVWYSVTFGIPRLRGAFLCRRREALRPSLPLGCC